MTSLSGALLMAAKRARYAAAQSARIAWFTGHYLAGRRKMGPISAPGAAPQADEFPALDRKRLRQAFQELFRADWRNIESGVYKMPLEIRRPTPPAELARMSRDYLLDTEKVARRKAAHGHSEVLSEERLTKFPRYFLQNFHYQTDGWLSPSSADRYDMQVETLFTGAAAAMRRQALPAIRSAIGGRDPADIRLLDLGCGTGGFLAQVKDNWPLLRTTALDLSPAYLGKARAELGGLRHVDFREAKAEATGLEDASMDIVTAVYLFHELPPKTRVEVAREVSRLLKPGGYFILVDSLQYGDEPGLDSLLENFPRAFHEPYYDSYCREDFGALFEAAGLKEKKPTLALLTKIVPFQKREIQMR